MIRTFCDCCGSEITGANTTAAGNKDLGRLTAKVKAKGGEGTAPCMQVEVITGSGSTWNSGHFCKHCVIDAIKSMDDRPVCANEARDLSRLVDRFLGWKLPKTFGPDAGIKFTPSNGMSREEAYEKPGWWPIGTNLLTAEEARAMLAHVLEIAQ